MLLITHAAYLDLPYFHHREAWDIVIDEVPQCDTFYDPRLPRSWSLLNEHLDIGRVIGKRLGHLVPHNLGSTRHYLEQPRDDGEEVARKIIADVCNPNKRVFVDLASWERMVERAKVSTKLDDANRICFLSMLSAQAFRGATVMGADVEQSLLWHWLGMNGVEWTDNTSITQRLRYKQYPTELAQRVHVHHVFDDDGHWSKKKRNEAGCKMDDAIKAWVGDDRFLLVQNNDAKSSLTALPGCQQMSPVCHGLNRFQGYNRLVFTSALNRKNMHRGMLNDLGIGDEVQRQSIVYSVLHQAVMRTSLRNPMFRERVNILVPDRWMADDVACALGGAYICDAAGKLPKRFRVNKHGNASSSCTRNTKNEDYKNSILLDFGVASSTSSRRKPQRARGGPCPDIDDEPTCSVHIQWNQLRPRRDDPTKSYDTRFESQSVPVLKLVTYLEKMHKRVRTEKTGDKLFQLTMFDEDFLIAMEGYITAGFLNTRNFMFSYGLLLDFDGGSVTPDEFIRIFWTDAGSRTKHAFIICNTFSSSPAKSKFRVVLPFRESTHSIAQFKAVVDSIVKRLEENGHPAKQSGLDPRSRNVVQRYYLPCTNAAHPNSAFFETYGLRRTDEFLRYAINPADHIPVPRKERKRLMISPKHSGAVNAQRILDDAEELKAKIEGMFEDRRDLVFQLACKLAAVWPLDQVQDDLMDWAPNDKVEEHVESAMEYLDNLDWTQAA